MTRIFALLVTVIATAIALSTGQPISSLQTEWAGIVRH
jgi:hypothetical protein